jgi:hypothetical protein
MLSSVLRASRVALLPGITSASPAWALRAGARGERAVSETRERLGRRGLRAAAAGPRTSEVLDAHQPGRLAAPLPIISCVTAVLLQESGCGGPRNPSTTAPLHHCTRFTGTVAGMATQSKIHVANPVVDLDGDEMTR